MASSMGCAPLLYGDDLDSCTDARSCSNGDCVRIDVDQRKREIGGALLRGDVRLAQTWTVATSGSLVELRLITYCDDGVSIEGVTAGGTPDGVERARAQAARRLDYSSPDATEMTSFPLQSPLAVSAGQQLAIVMRQPDGCGFGIDQTAAAYRGGKVSISDGTSDWLVVEDALYFMTLQR
jgi:hypothetical protein